MLKGLYKALDTDDSGTISIEELTAGISLFTKGSRAEKLSVAFNIYDLDKSGSISREELGELFKAEVLSGLRAIHGAVEFDAIDAEAGGNIGKLDVEESLDSGLVSAKEDDSGKVTMSVSIEAGKTGAATIDAKQLLRTDITDVFAALEGQTIVDDLVAQAFQEADKNADDAIEFDEFVKFVKKHPKLTDWFEILAV